MLYYIYIGESAQTISHLQSLADGMFMAVPNVQSAVEVVKGIRERYNTLFLFEQQQPKSDCRKIATLHEQCPFAYIILVTDQLQSEDRKSYLQAGVHNTLSPRCTEPVIRTIEHFLEIRKEHRLQEFSQAHGTAVLILSPLLLATAVAIRLESKGQIIYRSQRVGSNYQIFDFLKFRSMYSNADKRLKELNALNQYSQPVEAEPEVASSGESEWNFDNLTGSEEEEAMLMISDDCIFTQEDFQKEQNRKKEQTYVKIANYHRLTRLGRYNLKYPIHDIPQHITLTTDASIARDLAPAGLTGLSHEEKRGGAGNMSAEERKQLDIRYAHEFSFLMDMKILLRTFTAFIQKEDV